jgi:hypothetical protein
LLDAGRARPPASVHCPAGVLIGLGVVEPPLRLVMQLMSRTISLFGLSDPSAFW